MKLYAWLGNLPFPQCLPHFRDFLCQYTANDPIPSNYHTAFHSGDVHNLFKHFSLDEQLHGFHFFPSPDKAAVNILVHSCGLVRVSLWVTGLQVLCWRNVPLKCYRYCQTAFQNIFTKTTAYHCMILPCFHTLTRLSILKIFPAGLSEAPRTPAKWPTFPTDTAATS